MYCEYPVRRRIPLRRGYYLLEGNCRLGDQPDATSIPDPGAFSDTYLAFGEQLKQDERIALLASIDFSTLSDSRLGIASPAC